MSSISVNIESDNTGDSGVMREILDLYNKGAEVLFSRSHTGEAKIKVKYGPFKLRIARYTVNDKTAVAIKNTMRARDKTS